MWELHPLVVRQDCRGQASVGALVNDFEEQVTLRGERRSTLIASQLPPTAWHAAIGEPSVADAICDRLIHRAHKLTLKGPTMRDPETRRGGKGKS